MCVAHYIMCKKITLRRITEDKPQSRHYYYYYYYYIVQFCSQLSLRFDTASITLTVEINKSSFFWASCCQYQENISLPVPIYKSVTDKSKLRAADDEKTSLGRLRRRPSFYGTLMRVRRTIVDGNKGMAVSLNRDATAAWKGCFGPETMTGRCSLNATLQ